MSLDSEVTEVLEWNALLVPLNKHADILKFPFFLFLKFSYTGNVLSYRKFHINLNQTICDITAQYDMTYGERYRSRKVVPTK